MCVNCGKYSTNCCLMASCLDLRDVIGGEALPPPREHPGPEVRTAAAESGTCAIFEFANFLI